MKILTIHKPHRELGYMHPTRHGKGQMAWLPVHKAVVDFLPKNVKAIIALSDLQGENFILSVRIGCWGK